MRPEWVYKHPSMSSEQLGELPYMLNSNNPKSAREQLNDGYPHGGGWNPFNGFCLGKNNSLTYPGDPPLKPLAEAKLREETIILYSHSWVAIIQPDRSFEVCRMD